jgi:hypothetical protein
VRNVRSRKTLLEEFAFNQKDLRLPPYDNFARYCVKMATGSGKTKVMSLVITWQFANAVKEGRDDYAKTFLILAPNVIVFDRLKTDFENGLIFKKDPLIPRHYHLWWDMQYYMRGEPERTSSAGNLYLTNIQQFYERTAAQNSPEPDIMTAMLGPVPPSRKHDISDFDDRIAAHEGAVTVLTTRRIIHTMKTANGTNSYAVCMSANRLPRRSIFPPRRGTQRARFFPGPYPIIL